MAIAVHQFAVQQVLQPIQRHQLTLPRPPHVRQPPAQEISILPQRLPNALRRAPVGSRDRLL